MKLLLFPMFAAALAAAPLDVRHAPASIDPANPALRLTRTWQGDLCRSRIVNRGKVAVRVRQITLFHIAHSLAGDTGFYGESFQMLSQTAGTLAKPVELGYDELKHYKLPQPAGVKAASGMITLTPPGEGTMLLAFTSSRRFHGRFFVSPDAIDVVLDTENLELAPGAGWELEEFTYQRGPDRAKLLANLAAAINRNHPPLRVPQPPTGWCSWYCFGPRVTAKNVLDNLDAIATRAPGLKYVQLDDGYQAAMGDWLETGNAFGGNIRDVLRSIRERGFEPAIWVAPFIAEAGSHVFQQHPDWFMKGADGKPLPANLVTFGGWRRGPWYALDGTHPEVQRHLETLFRTMRQEWGVTYFKLDANFWGAMHGGRLHDPAATRIEAYRRGMQAVLRGAGDSFILGCNHPIWASFGLIHGSRSSADISRKWSTFAQIATQNLNRNWQNGTLWWNDPDAVTLSGSMPEDEYRFHATSVLATGGMVLSGDDLSTLPTERLEMFRKLLPPTRHAAVFGNDLRIGVIRLADRTLITLLNFEEAPAKFDVALPGEGVVTELWSGVELGKRSGHITIDMPGRSGKVLIQR